MKNQRPQLSDEFFQVPKKQKPVREKKKLQIKLTKKHIAIISIVLGFAAFVFALYQIKVPIDYSYVEEKLHVGYSNDGGVIIAAWYPDCAKHYSGYISEYDVVHEDTKTVYESYYIALEVSLLQRIFVPDGYYVLGVYQHYDTDFQFDKDGTYLYGEPINEGGMVGRIYYRDGDGTDHLIWENEALTEAEK